MPDSSVCGFPDVENTGVKPGIDRQAVSGTVRLSTPGQVYENKTVTGEILIEADNVTVRNVKFINRSPDYGIRSFGRSGILLEDVEINLGGELDTKGIAFDGYTLRRAFIHNGSDCAHFGSQIVIEDSLCSLGPDANDDGWPDGSSFCGGTEHFDGFQSDGGDHIIIRHNTIRNPCSQTSTILMSTNTSAISNVTIADNLVAGGGYTIYCGSSAFGPASNLSLTNNRFARTWFPNAGYYGPTSTCDNVSKSGNVWDDTNAPL